MDDSSRKFTLASSNTHILLALYYSQVHNDNTLLDRLFEITEEYVSRGMTSDTVLSDLNLVIEQDLSLIPDAQTAVWETALDELDMPGDEYKSVIRS